MPRKKNNKKNPVKVPKVIRKKSLKRIERFIEEVAERIFTRNASNILAEASKAINNEKVKILISEVRERPIKDAYMKYINSNSDYRERVLKLELEKIEKGLSIIREKFGR